MITIHYDLHGLTVRGHAPRPEGAAPGENIVCAAVSALTLTLIEGLEAFAGMRMGSTAESGNAKIQWLQITPVGKVLIDTWYIGVQNIQDSYPGTIEIV